MYNLKLEKMKIGILKETKIPADKRVPLSPVQCKELFSHLPQVKVIVQPSATRCYFDEEYEETGILLDENVADCDVLLGIKEVKPEILIDGKTYLFFSHTAKMQPYNKELLKTIIDKKITLIDYEYLIDKEGDRLIGFGKWAGIVGAYNGIRGFCIKNKLKEPKPAHTCQDFKEFKKAAQKVELPPVKIVITGNGRVAKGAVSLLDTIGIERVSESEFLSDKKINNPVYTQIDVDAYNAHKDGKEFDMQHFFASPQEYKSDFNRFVNHTDLLIMAAYWDSKAPKLLSKEDMRQEDFNIRVIADITCDIEGAIASTLRPSTIEDPFYGYNPNSEQEELAFVSPDNICIMAVDNLPNELPKDASLEFGANLTGRVFPELISGDKTKVIERATIVKEGKITDTFSYLKEWLNS